jgi:YaiO family outer membrane protein
MTFVRLICAAAILASGTVTNAATPVSRSTPAKALKRGSSSSTVRVEYTDFSKLYGSRTVLTAESKLGTGQRTQFIVSGSAGERTGGSTHRAAQASVAVVHDWTDRLSTQTTAAQANNGFVFARTMVGQDISYKVGRGLVGTIGGKYSNYGGGHDVATWSAGAAYYWRGAFINYRYSIYASNRFGRSHAHLASLRLYDPGSGKGFTQLWVGHGTSLFEVELPRTANGSFTSVALQRSQPIGGGIALNVGVNRGIYRTPTGRYSGTGMTGGLSFSRWPL